MTELTNEELLDAFDTALEYDIGVADARAAVRARMAGTFGWQPLCAVADPKALGEVLLRAFYPSRETASDVYHGWYSRGDWVRWPHVFPPTHYMPVLPLPTAARSAGPGRPE